MFQLKFRNKVLILENNIFLICENIFSAKLDNGYSQRFQLCFNYTFAINFRTCGHHILAKLNVGYFHRLQLCFNYTFAINLKSWKITSKPVETIFQKNSLTDIPTTSTTRNNLLCRQEYFSNILAKETTAFPSTAKQQNVILQQGTKQSLWWIFWRTSNNLSVPTILFLNLSREACLALRESCSVSRVPVSGLEVRPFRTKAFEKVSFFRLQFYLLRCCPDSLVPKSFQVSGVFCSMKCSFCSIEGFVCFLISLFGFYSSIC